MADVSLLMALDAGPIDGLYPNPLLGTSLMVSAPMAAEGKMGFSDMVN